MAAKHLLDIYLFVRHVLFTGPPSCEERSYTHRLRPDYHSCYCACHAGIHRNYGCPELFGLATLITAFLQPLLRRIPAYAGIPISFLLFLLTREVPSGYLGFEGLRLAALPRFLYQGKLMMVLGFPYDGFYSTDYFSVIPWLFLFLTGYYVWKLLECADSSFLSFLRRSLCRPLELIGRNTLPVYMLHQPALMAVFTALDLIGMI